MPSQKTSHRSVGAAVLTCAGVAFVACGAGSGAAGSTPRKCDHPQETNAAIGSGQPGKPEPKCEFGKSDPAAEPVDLFFLSVRKQPTAGKVRVEGLITVRFEVMFIRDVKTGKTYWLDLTRESFPALIPCDGFYGELEGYYNPGLRTPHRAYPGGEFRDVSYVRGRCHLGVH
jgi:hypothetical protein